jgi:hypothetical protein
MLVRTVVAAWALGWCSQVACADLLVNGNLDDPPDHETDIATGWTLEEPDVDIFGDPVNSATFATFANHTPGGVRGLWLRPFEGGINDENPDTVTAHLYQDVPGVPGVQYTLSAWFRMEANYSGLDPAAPTQTVLALEFHGAGGVLLAAGELDIDLAYIPGNTWQQFTIISVAPLGTTTVRVRASMLDGVIDDMNPQSAFVDDFVLVPGPSALAFLACAVVIGNRRRRND